MDEALALARVRKMTRSGAARLIRTNAGLSLAEVARAVGPGVDPSTVLRWERGATSPHGSKALAYARLLEGLAAG